MSGLDIHTNDAGTRFTIINQPLHFPAEGITVPVGYTCDGPSIPKWAGFWLPRVGRYLKAAFLHDFLYDWHHTVVQANSQGLSVDAPPGVLALLAWGGRKAVDLAFLHQMQRDGIGWRTRYTMYLAVRVFGGFYWNKKL